MNFATFILSTGRCGTQWLAKNLHEAYGNRLAVAHEPLFIHYSPRQLLGVKDPALCEDAPLIFKHFNRIEDVLNTVPYIECGWENYGALRYLVERFRGHIRIVHLTRHPMQSASSMVTHHYYTAQRQLMDELNEKALLTPFDDGMSFPEYRNQWETMSPLGKCLYFWLEVHSLGLRLQDELGVPWLRLQSEKLLDGDALPQLLEFLELPHSEKILDARNEWFDRFPLKVSTPLDPLEVQHHPQVIKLAKDLGYDALNVDAQKIKARYEA